jgi:hypothetical protein
MEDYVMHGLGKFFVMQFKLYLREPLAFFFSLAYPALLLLLFGFIYGNQPAPEFWGRKWASRSILPPTGKQGYYAATGRPRCNQQPT